MDILIGYTGFVGTNINSKHEFSAVFNSKNIQEAYGTNPDICIYSGVRAEMFLANNDPEVDLANIKAAIENIKKINPKKLVLISTVAVYDRTLNVNENAVIEDEKLAAYGKNRRYLEKWVENELDNYSILRLPALYGKNLKKNFIYDIITISPAMLSKQKLDELCKKDGFIKGYYVLQENGFYKCTDLKAVRSYFEQSNFNALSFTDSRSVYQFYHLEYLWEHIKYALEHNIKILNLVTEPVSAAELYQHIFDKEFVNELPKTPFHYNIKTNYFEGGYIFDKLFVLDDIKKFAKGKRL